MYLGSHMLKWRSEKCYVDHVRMFQKCRNSLSAVFASSEGSCSSLHLVNLIFNLICVVLFPGVSFVWTRQVCYPLAFICICFLPLFPLLYYTARFRCLQFESCLTFSTSVSHEYLPENMIWKSQ